MPAARMRTLVSAMSLALLLLPILPAGAVTLLLAVTETEEGQPAAPPLAAREGILAALFDAELLAFELPPGEPVPSPEDLRLLAAEAGADTVAIVVVEWSQERIAGGALHVSARGSIILVDPRTGRETARAPFERRNDGRERAVNRADLGVEIGSVLVGLLSDASGGG
jgi:hypothetical protein